MRFDCGQLVRRVDADGLYRGGSLNGADGCPTREPRNEWQEVSLPGARRWDSLSCERGQIAEVGVERQIEEAHIRFARVRHRISFAALADPHDLAAFVSIEMDVRRIHL